jgi:hypothetical protein
VHGGHGGGVFPHWQASMVEQQSKEDVGIGDIHAQDNVTFSSGDLSRKNGETFPIFSGKKVTAPALAPKTIAAENCALNANCKKSMQSKASSDPHISTRTGSDDYGSGSDTESYKNADFHDTDEEPGNYAASSEIDIVMLGHTISIGNKNIKLCYDSGAAPSVIHKSIAAPMHTSEYGIQSVKSACEEAAHTVKINIYHDPERGGQVQLSMGLDKHQCSLSIAAVEKESDSGSTSVGFKWWSHVTAATGGSTLASFLVYAAIFGMMLPLAMVASPGLSSACEAQPATVGPPLALVGPGGLSMASIDQPATAGPVDLLALLTSLQSD